MEFEYQALANTSKDMGTILLLNIINMKVFIGCPRAWTVTLSRLMTQTHLLLVRGA